MLAERLIGGWYAVSPPDGTSDQPKQTPSRCPGLRTNWCGSGASRRCVERMRRRTRTRLTLSSWTPQRRESAWIGIRCSPWSQALEWIVEWYREFQAGADLRRFHANSDRTLRSTLKSILMPASVEAATVHVLEVTRVGEARVLCQTYVVLGAGMAGFGAAHRLHAEGITPVMYDKNAYHGGHTASFRYESGFPVRRRPAHFLHQGSAYSGICSPTASISEYETIQINLNNYWRGHWPLHPVQLHLHGLPEDVIVKVISDFVEERQQPESAGQELRRLVDWPALAGRSPSSFPCSTRGSTTPPRPTT